MNDRNVLSSIRQSHNQAHRIETSQASKHHHHHHHHLLRLEQNHRQQNQRDRTIVQPKSICIYRWDEHILEDSIVRQDEVRLDKRGAKHQYIRRRSMPPPPNHTSPVAKLNLYSIFTVIIVVLVFCTYTNEFMFCLPMSTVAAFKLDPNLHHKPPPSPPLPSSEAKATAKASILDANSNNNNNNNNQIRLIDRKILEHTFGQSIRTANESISVSKQPSNIGQINRQPRTSNIASSSSSFSAMAAAAATAAAQNRYRTFTILAILPEESAPSISRALRDAQTKWESSGHASTFELSKAHFQTESANKLHEPTRRVLPNLPSSIRASDIPLVVISEPANNDTERLLTFVCEWITANNPIIVLSLLDKERNFFASQATLSAGIPFVSLTQSYRNEISTIADDHQVEIDFAETTLSLFDDLLSPSSIPQRPNVFTSLNEPSSLTMSLDPPIQTLADATFELLRAQYWFDAILIVDDSIVSDLFVRRLNALCSNSNEIYPGREHGKWRRSTSNKDQLVDAAKLDNTLYGDGFAWSNFKKSSLRKSQFRMAALNDHQYDGIVRAELNFGADDARRRLMTDAELLEMRRSKEASLLGVWNNLIVIRLSRSLAQTEFYLRMAQIQTSHRRVVLIHADWSTTQRVVNTARELDLFKGDKIWMLLDGMLDQRPDIFNPTGSNVNEQPMEQRIDLPNGMLALRHRKRLIDDPNMLDSIVKLTGKAALNSLRNELYWNTILSDQSSSNGSPLHKSHPSASSSPTSFSFSSSSFYSSSSSQSSNINNVPVTETPFSTLSSNPYPNGCGIVNYTDSDRKHRINILSELRNLVEPVLSRYKWNRRRPCSSLRSSAKTYYSGKEEPHTNYDRNRAMDEMMNHYDHMVDDTKTDEGIIERADELESRIDNSDLYRWIVPEFEILNLVPVKDDIRKSEWRSVGNVTADQATVNTILYIGADKVPDYIMYDGPDGPNYRPDSQNNPESRPLMYMTNSGKHRFRVVTNIAPPFVIESTKLDNNTCLTGDFCLKIETNVREDLISIFTDFRSQRRLYENKKYVVKCCAGIAIDLLNAVARDLHFDYDLYLVADGLFGVKKDGQWDGVTADLVNDLAHLTFTAFSTTSSRVQAIDYSVPFFYSGVSCLSVSSNETDVPLLAFLIPFSYELWAAIFAGLFATAVAAAIYEWFSPFGLNPWGRQRTKNFSLASALWVMCSLLFSHLVAFKAPKSWPNKVLINVWGAFSVIFLATYTANIAAHFAGLFLVPEVNDFHDTSLMKQRTGTARSSASEGYLMEKYTDLWHYIKRHKVDSFDEGLEHLRAGILDVLIGDTAILDYFRATDPGCSLRLLGDSIFDDAYAVGMQKGFPFRESISNLILKYNEYGFLDQLHRKWYGRVHCLESSSLTKPKPLTVRAEAGVFLMLGFGILVGIIILFAEHFVFKYILPLLRKKSKDCFWKSPNLMFFSQKLYRFINTVELVSPHHSAKEIITNLREGQIASLFQKSVKRKAKEEARRRKSKSQFFEMIQEVRKVVQRQQQERSLQEDDDDDDNEEMLKLGLDEESINNTNANRDTRASFMLSKENSLIEQDRIGNRVSAIRFKEPEIFDDLNRRLIDINRKPESDTNRRLISNLKYGDQNITGPLARTETCNYEQNDQNEQIKRRREALRKCHLSSNSFSLEDIFFQGLLSEGVNGPKKSFPKCGRRILSFEDLPAIKKELSESSNDHYDGNSPYDLSLERPSSRTSTTRGRISKATTVPFDLSHHRHRPIDHNVSGLSRNDILSLWQASERELMLRLEESIEQRRVLEEKIALLQRTLMKPP